ncbi:hypothetical protein A4D02_16085 [Niastella koreensis]|uniref:Uncharacterized protein n=2 Tax=Niastella koreensis TaxID=354356 RepID=G8TN68_NIAKG|nr:hypothetical protein [Niastella koreensis]AEV97753.1 hypothetical protein Niako_1382 [Niastella koreensis GR20-10]OQP40432.1 hypothetical protein A4D02_16085 [Niastella koreensis]
MRKLLIILVLTFLIFIILNYSTAKFEGAVDGEDTMGFPLTYFRRFAYGEVVVPPPIPTETFYWKLLFDILFAACMGIVGFTIFTKVWNSFKK